MVEDPLVSLEPNFCQDCLDSTAPDQGCNFPHNWTNWKLSNVILANIIKGPVVIKDEKEFIPTLVGVNAFKENML